MVICKISGGAVVMLQPKFGTRSRNGVLQRPPRLVLTPRLVLEVIHVGLSRVPRETQPAAIANVLDRGHHGIALDLGSGVSPPVAAALAAGRSFGYGPIPKGRPWMSVLFHSVRVFLNTYSSGV